MQAIKVKDKKLEMLKSIKREFEYFLKFLGVEENIVVYQFDGEYYIEIKERSLRLNFEFFNLNREDKMLYLIAVFFSDYKLVQYIYLRLYNNRQERYIKEKLRINDKEIKELKLKILRKKYDIMLS